MGLVRATWEAIGRHKEAAKTILCLGYPDLLVPEEVLRESCDPVEVPNGEKIASWHGWGGRIFDTTRALEQAFGLEPSYADIKAHRGVEWHLDLNQPMNSLAMQTRLDRDLLWDIVLDPGSLEHCFNIGQAFENVRLLVRPGGLVIHVNPMNQPNHGFWSISPTAYFDFWESHGGTVLEARLLNGNEDVDLDMRERRTKRILPNFPANILVVVRAGERDGPSWPMQAKYR